MNFNQLASRINQGFESSSCTTPEFKTFASKFRSALKKELKAAGAELVSFSRGHFYISGFYRVGSQLGYYSISDVRSGEGRGFTNRPDILFRTAQHEKDYTGGANQYVTMEANLVGEQLARIA